MSIKLYCRQKRLHMLALPLVGVLLNGCGDTQHAGIAQIHGDFSVVSRLQPHSLSQVRIEVGVSFHCPACYRFQHSLDLLSAKYGKRLLVHQTAITPRGGSGRPERFFLLARRAGLERTALDALFRARFDSKLDIEQTEVLAGLARQIGLVETLMSQLDSTALKQEQLTIDAKAKAFVAFTPSVLIEDQLLIEPDAAAIADVVDSLLVQR